MEKIQVKMNHQEKIFQYMEASEFYPHPVSKIEQRETHISKVFLIFILKKAFIPKVPVL